MAAVTKAKSLWHHQNFLKLWAGQSVSLLGSQVTSLALPLTAVLILKASAFEMGMLGAVQFAPFLFLSLFAGVWIDRLPRRPILIWSDVGRFILLGSIPLAFVLHFLSIWYLYAIGLLVGILTVFFEVASQAYLPNLLQTEQLLEGNTKLEVSRSLAQIGGPGLAGFLVQLVAPPIAIIVDALSFGFSALSLQFISEPQTEADKADVKPHGSIFQEIKVGMSQLLGNVYTRSLIFCGTTRSFFSNMMVAVLTLFMVKELGLEPFVIGLVAVVGGAGTLLGASFAVKAAHKFGLGASLVGGAILVGIGNLITPFAAGPKFLAIAILMFSTFVAAAAAPFYGVNQISLRQAITPLELQGRVNASVRFMAWGALAIGSLAGGALGQLIGLRLTLAIGAFGTLLSSFWIFFSPVRTLHDQPSDSV